MNTYTYDFNQHDIYQRAMRRVARHGQLAYGKLLSLRVLASKDTPYGATDGRTLFLNPDGLRRLELTSDPVGYTAFLLVHEALHAQLSHATRLRKLRDHETANKAADYVINAMIVDMNKAALHNGVKNPPFPLIDRVLIDESLSQDRHVVELYNILKANANQQPPQPKAQPQPQPADDSSEDSDDSDEGAGDSDSDDSDEGTGTGGASEGAGAAADEGEGEGAADDEGEGSGAGAEGKPMSDSDILGDWVGTDSAASDLAEPQLENGETVEDFENSVDAANESIELQDSLSGSAGLGSSDARKLSEQRRRWKGLDWVEYVRQWMSDRIDSDWNKPLNVSTFATTGLVEDDRSNSNMGELAVVIDTSCSVPDSVVREMLDATQDALNTLSPRAIHLISVDHKVQQYECLSVGDTVPSTLKGGGGTLFRPAFRFLEENAPNLDGILFLTDGEAADWEGLVEPQTPVLWLDWNPYRTVDYSFGEVIKVSEK